MTNQSNIEFKTLIYGPVGRNGLRSKNFNKILIFNPSVTDAHSSERQDKPTIFFTNWKQLEADLKLNCGFLLYAPWALMGLLSLKKQFLPETQAQADPEWQKIA